MSFPSINKLLIFDLKGSIAHYRKCYTNSSSLSYSFPPRTAIIGLIAGISGWERDSYYEEFNKEKCRVAISIQKPVRKIMHSVNYIRTKDADGFSGFENLVKKFIERKINTYPTPLELVFPIKLSDEIVYRVFFWHKNEALLSQLHERIKERRFVYPPCLGISEFLANIYFVDFIPSKKMKVLKKNNGFLEIATVVNKKCIKELNFDLEKQNESLQYVDERMPLEFAPDRKIKENACFIHEKNQRVISGKFKSPCLKIIYHDPDEVEENIIFMEQEI